MVSGFGFFFFFASAGDAATSIEDVSASRLVIWNTDRFIENEGDTKRARGQQAFMQNSWDDIAGDANSKILLIADHASNFVPEGVSLGIPADLLELHIAWDLGVEPLSHALCTSLGCPAILGGVSRLVIDYNREADAAHLVPTESDGHNIPGNFISGDDLQNRLERFWHPYHARIAAQIVAQSPRLLISLHSFTPRLGTRPEEVRPWEIGVLYNGDDRAARVAIPVLEAGGLIVGDQLPYSGKLLNATMNLHGEGNGIAYLGLEVRQDLIADDDGVSRMARHILPAIKTCLASPLINPA